MGDDEESLSSVDELDVLDVSDVVRLLACSRACSFTYWAAPFTLVEPGSGTLKDDLSIKACPQPPPLELP